MSAQMTPFRFDRVFNPAPVLGDGGLSRSAMRPSENADELHREIERLHAHYKAELEKARMDGFQTGLAQARNEREAAVLTAVDAMHLNLDQLREQFGMVVREVKSEVAALAIDAAEAIAGKTIRDCPLDLIERTLIDVVDQVAVGDTIEITVHPDLLGPMQDALQSQSRLRRREPDLLVIADEAIEFGDARIVWKKGGAELDRAERSSAVRAEIEAILSGEAEIEAEAAPAEGVPLLLSVA